MLEGWKNTMDKKKCEIFIESPHTPTQKSIDLSRIVVDDGDDDGWSK